MRAKIWCLRLGVVTVIGGLLLAASFLWCFPVPVLPGLPGPHEVGTFSVEIPAVQNEDRLLVQLWYPSDSVAGVAPVPWLLDAAMVPSFPYQRMADAVAHARPDVSPTVGEGLFPVIFYEHSWQGSRGENIAQVESLASRGFVVVAIDHPGQARRVRFPDGAVVTSRLPANVDLSSEENVAAFEMLAADCMKERTANVERVRAALAHEAGKLTGRLDLEKLGVFGFSFGGSHALQLCAENPAFVAGANEDGWIFSEAPPKGAFLFFDEEMPGWLGESKRPDEDPEQALTRRSEARIQAALARPHASRVVLNGTRHLSFTDQIFSSPVPRLARVGTRSAADVHGILSGNLAKLFSTHLRKSVAAGD